MPARPGQISRGIQPLQSRCCCACRLDLRERSLIMVTCAGDAAPDAVPAEVRWLRARVAELEAQNEVTAAQLAARDAQLEMAQAKLAVLAEQAGELRRR